MVKMLTVVVSTIFTGFFADAIAKAIYIFSKNITIYADI